MGNVQQAGSEWPNIYLLGLYLKRQDVQTFEFGVGWDFELTGLTWPAVKKSAT
jgi:hypothetical protein